MAVDNRVEECRLNLDFDFLHCILEDFTIPFTSKVTLQATSLFFFFILPTGLDFYDSPHAILSFLVSLLESKLSTNQYLN